MRFVVSRICKKIIGIKQIWQYFYKKYCFKYYDKNCKNYTIIPFGEYCMPRVITTLNLLKPTKSYGELSFPFDLTFSDFKTNVSLLDNHFEGFFDDIIFNDDKKCFENTKLNFCFKHDGKIEKEKFIKRYKKRIENLYDILVSNKQIYFLTALTNNINSDDIKILINTIEKYRKENYLIIILNQSEREIENSIKNTKIINLVNDEDFIYINKKGTWAIELEKQKTKQARRFYNKVSNELENIIRN